MRTTLNLDDALILQAKRHAIEQGCTLTRVIEDALRAELNQRTSADMQFKLRWNSVSGTLRPGVDLSDRDALYQLMDAPE